MELFDQENNKVFALDSLVVDVDLYSLLYRAINIADLEVNKPELYVVNNQDKTINLLNLIKNSDQTVKKEDVNTTAKPMRLIIDDLKLDDAQIHYTDYTRDTPFHFTFDRIDLELQDIDTHDFNSSDGSFAFYSNLGDGAFVKLITQIDGFQPFGIHGHIDFKANQLYTEWKYIQDIVNFEIADGKASFNCDFHFNADELEQTKISNINISLEKLRIKPKDKAQNIITLQNLYVADASTLPMRQELSIGTIGLNTLNLKANREKDGTIDLVHYFVPETTSEQNQTKSDTSEWKVFLKKISLANINTTFTDHLIEPNV